MPATPSAIRASGAGPVRREDLDESGTLLDPSVARPGDRPCRGARRRPRRLPPRAGGGEGQADDVHLGRRQPGRRSPARWSRATSRRNPDVEIEFWESTNAATYPKMLAAKQANPSAPLVNFGYFNVDLSNRGDTDDMWVPMDRRPHPGAGQAAGRPAPAGQPGPRLLGQPRRAHVQQEPRQGPAHVVDRAVGPEVAGQGDVLRQQLRPARRSRPGSTAATSTSIDPGFRLWTEHARNIRALPTTNDALKNIVVTGEAQIAPWFSAIWKFWADEGAPLGFVNPKEGRDRLPALPPDRQGQHARPDHGGRGDRQRADDGGEQLPGRPAHEQDPGVPDADTGPADGPGVQPEGDRDRDLARLGRDGPEGQRVALRAGRRRSSPGCRRRARMVHGADVDVRAITKRFGAGRRRRGGVVQRAGRGVLLAPRPVRLRQDHDPPGDRRLRDRRRGRHPDRGPVDGPAPAQPPRDQHGLPAAGPLSPLLRVRQRGLRTQDAPPPGRRGRTPRRRRARAGASSAGSEPGASASCRAASSSGSPSRAPSSTSPASSSSTSRCPPST